MTGRDSVASEPPAPNRERANPAEPCWRVGLSGCRQKGGQPRLLFCSYHCYWDPSSGAALCTRELFELLAQRGWLCRVFCGPRLDFEQGPSLEQFLAAQAIAFDKRQTPARETPLAVYHFRQGGVPLQIFERSAAGRCLAAAEAWRPERLLPRFEEFFAGTVHRACLPRSSSASL